MFKRGLRRKCNLYEDACEGFFLKREEPKPLKIAFVGYTYELGLMGLRILTQENEDDIALVKKDRLRFKDGTELIVVGNEPSIRGCRFDQLILFDDHRWEIYHKQRELIGLIKDWFMDLSCVPDEYQILEYQYF